MTQPLQAIRGMNDLLPADTPLWAGIEDTVRDLLSRYGYREMRIPLLEYTTLFQRSIGEVTDIVEKEMYTFADRNGDSLTLRPEATAGFVRACIQHGLLHNRTQRLWCIGPMFRYEKPQKGRSRQFHQVDVEAFGLEGPDIDAELILLTSRLWRELGLNGMQLQLNSLGSPESRATYRDRLVHYFESRYDELDEDSRARLHRNPLRILDSKNPRMASLIDAAPILLDDLDDASATHFESLREMLDQAGIDYQLNPRLVRGLDYYNRTVFEWVGDHLGAQNTVCGGGRYDGLVAHLGGRPTPGIGFAIGLERLTLIAAACGFQNPQDITPHAYLIMVGPSAEQHGLALAERLRDRVPELRLTVNCGGGSFKSQFKRADRSGARYALVLGDEELSRERIAVKPLRQDEPQHDLTESALVDFLQNSSSFKC